MLKINNLSKTFGAVTAVDNVSLNIKPGEMIGVIGRSGAGKSTMLRLINRLVDPCSGSINFNGAEVTDLKGPALRRWRAKCAMIFQQFNLVNRMDVLTNVLIGRLGYHSTLPSLFKKFNAAEKAAGVKALQNLDMVACALQRADTLSGGQQQRVAIAKAMVQEPDLILADEPIASLDPHNAAKVMDALRRINRDQGITVICNLHHLHTARAYSNRIIGMARGRIVFDGRPSELTMEKAMEVYGADGDSEELMAALGNPMSDAGGAEIIAAA